MKKIVSIICLTTLIGCSSLKILKTENTALLALSASTSHLGGTGKGMIVTLRNSATGEKYEAKRLSHFSPYCFVQNIKPGRYYVEKITLDTGGNKFSNWSNNVRDYSGDFSLEGGNKYYLGSFKGKVKLKLKNAIGIILEDTTVPEKMEYILMKQNSGWAKGEFESIETVSREELIIY